MLRELRQATRGLAARPWLTLVIAAALALGLGANSAIFSVIDALLLRPPLFRQRDQLLRIGPLIALPAE